MGLPNEQWRFTTLNNDYELSATYPRSVLNLDCPATRCGAPSCGQITELSQDLRSPYDVACTTGCLNLDCFSDVPF